MCLHTWAEFARNVDWLGLLALLGSACAALLCICVHELCHGLAALGLGDATARDAGRLTLNPLRHVDPVGFLLMLTVHVGWARPVPVDMNRFRHPRRDMALTALAGPLSNLALAWLALLAVRGMYALPWAGSPAGRLALWALLDVAALSVGLGVFNLLPIPPLDGSKIALSFLPEGAYRAVLRVERRIGLVLMLLLWLGVFNAPLAAARGWVMDGLYRLSGF